MQKNWIIAVITGLAPLAAAVAEEGHIRGGMFERWDANSDGVVTRAEVEQNAAERARKHFDSLDADGDGTLTKAEVEQAHEQHRAAVREKAEDRFTSADTNGDGSLSKAEAEQGMPHVARRFEQLDTNKDGALSAEELRSLRKHRESRYTR
jgi:Ca2+-binding EF-hand superfamily protein